MVRFDSLTISKTLIFLNMILWFVAASVFSLTHFGINSPVIIKVLLFLESILYFVCFLGMRKRNKIVYIFALILTFGNTILSVTDEVDLSDIVSLVLSFATFLSLIFAYKYILKKTNTI